MHLVGSALFAILAVTEAFRHAPNNTVFGLVFVALLWGIPATLIGTARLLSTIVQPNDED